jgi:hypothetical protein
MLKIHPFLLAFALCASAFAADSAPDPGPVPTESETKAVAELAKLGIDARPIAAGINWRSALVRIGKEKPDPKIFVALKSVSNLQELDLAGLQLTDSDLAVLAELKNLRVLHLEKTPLTDAGLVHLKGLKQLTYLNIYSTQVTDAGLPSLQGLTNLKSLYVFETKVTDAGIADLQKSLPKVLIVKGLNAEDIAKLNAKPEEKKPVPAVTPAVVVATPENKAVVAEIAEAQKKVDAINLDLTKRREVRGKLTAGTPEYIAADKQVQELKPELEKATAALEVTKAKLKKP